MGTIRVLSPVVDSKVSQTAPLSLPGTLAGKRLGFLDNTKANFELLLRRMEAHTLGMEDLPLLVVDHPLGGEPAERIEARAARAVSQLLACLGPRPPGS